MTELVDAELIERVVGVSRHEMDHYGRALSNGDFYILHSAVCKRSGRDLRNCPFSLSLDSHPLTWLRFPYDTPVPLELSDGGRITTKIEPQEADNE